MKLTTNDQFPKKFIFLKLFWQHCTVFTFVALSRKFSIDFVKKEERADKGTGNSYYNLSECFTTDLSLRLTFVIPLLESELDINMIFIVNIQMLLTYQKINIM